MDWDAGIAIGDHEDVASSFILVKSSQAEVRYNDSSSHGFPLYSPYQQLAKVDGVLAATDDSPSFPNLANIEKNRVKGKLSYSFTRSIMSDKFICWACGLSNSTKQIYPLLENKWDLAIDSSQPIVNVSATVQNIEPTLPTLVPTRNPIANETLGPIEPTRVDSGTTRLTKQ